jgi:plasmid maintenance system antidote protein VapI
MTALTVMAPRPVLRQEVFLPETAWLFAGALGTTPEIWMNLQTMDDLARNRPERKIPRSAP